MHELEIAYRRLWEAMCAKDAIAIRKLCAPEYTLAHVTGDTQTLDEFIGDLLRGSLNYYRVHHDSVDAHTTGQGHGTLTAMSRIDATIYGSPRAEWRLRGELAAERHKGRWMFTSLATSLY